MSTPFSTQKIQQTSTTTHRAQTPVQRPVYNLLAGDNTQFTQEVQPDAPRFEPNRPASQAAGRFALWANPAYHILQAKAAAAARRS